MRTPLRHRAPEPLFHGENSSLVELNLRPALRYSMNRDLRLNSMVTRASSSAEQEGNSRGGGSHERLSTMHKDAIVLATAMASVPTQHQQDQARSPPNASASAQNHLHQHRDATPSGREEEESQSKANLPPSPMVTPPIRSYNAKKQLPKGSQPVGVPHVYHDYSQVPDVMGYVRKKTGG